MRGVGLAVVAAIVIGVGLVALAAQLIDRISVVLR